MIKHVQNNVFGLVKMSYKRLQPGGGLWRMDAGFCTVCSALNRTVHLGTVCFICVVFVDASCFDIALIHNHLCLFFFLTIRKIFSPSRHELRFFYLYHSHNLVLSRSKNIELISGSLNANVLGKGRSLCWPRQRTLLWMYFWENTMEAADYNNL